MNRPYACPAKSHLYSYIPAPPYAVHIGYVVVSVQTARYLPQRCLVYIYAVKPHISRHAGKEIRHPLLRQNRNLYFRILFCRSAYDRRKHRYIA